MHYRKKKYNQSLIAFLPLPFTTYKLIYGFIFISIMIILIHKNKKFDLMGKGQLLVSCDQNM